MLCVQEDGVCGTLELRSVLFDLWSPVLKESLCLQAPVACSFTGMLKQRLGSLRKAILLWVLSPGVGLWVLLVRRLCWYSSTVWLPLASQSDSFSSGDSRSGFPCSFTVCSVLESPQFSGPCPMSAGPPQSVVPEWKTVGCRIQLDDFLLASTYSNV